MEKPEWLMQMETCWRLLNEGVVIADDEADTICQLPVF